MKIILNDKSIIVGLWHPADPENPDEGAPVNAIDISVADETLINQYKTNRKYILSWDGSSVVVNRKLRYFAEVYPDKSFQHYMDDAPGRVALTDAECDQIEASKCGFNSFIYDNGLIPDPDREQAEILREAKEQKKRQAEAVMGLKINTGGNTVASTFAKIDALPDMAAVDAFDAADDVRQ